MENIETVPDRPLVSVIILNYNGMEHLEECLRSLSEQSFKNFEVVLVDNGSTDGSCDYVKAHFPFVRVIPLEENTGFCRGNNIGLEQARGSFVALLNNDTMADRFWLERLYNAVTNRPDVGICASRMVNYYQRDRLDTAGDGYDLCGVGFKIGHQRGVNTFGVTRPVFGACAGAALYRRSVIEDIGFFDEDFFAVGEDIDLSFRSQLAGYQCLFVPEAIVYHKINRTVGPGSDFLLYHARRNVEYVYIKNMPFALFPLSFPFHLLYNTLTLVQAVVEGRTRVFLRSKRDVFRQIPSLLRKRKQVQSLRKVSCRQLFSRFTSNYLWYRVIEGLRMQRSDAAVLGEPE